MDAAEEEDTGPEVELPALVVEVDAGPLDVPPPPPPSGRSALDQPVAAVWPALNTWSDRLEREYQDFVASLGQAVAARRCRRLDACLRDPTINTLYDAVTDGRLNLTVDCADLPYILRGYFAFKRRLPFGFVSSVRGVGDDPRYMTRMRPSGWRQWTQYRTPRDVLRGLTDQIHSGMYRFAPEVETGDLYPVGVTRTSIRPGSTYYDPNGHVLAVTEIRPDGTVYLIDGHPDGSLTFKRFGEAFAIGTRRLGGGFKNFRPLRWDGRTLTRATNAELADFDGVTQWSPAAWQPPPVDAGVDAGPPTRVTYHHWVRDQLAERGTVRDPVRDLREELEALCRDITDRADAVELSLAAGLQRQPHPASLPWNIYGTSGDWETYSSPSRDARLKAAVREITEGLEALSLATHPELRAQLVAVFRETAATPACAFHYTGSDGATYPLTLAQVLDRLWALSFDPYHCPELRWGAAPATTERQRCPDDPVKLRWYGAEQRLRNQIDRFYGVATPLEMGPTASPSIDPRDALTIAR